MGVRELIMTFQKINYAPEVDKVCKALEVGLSLFIKAKCLLSSISFVLLFAPCFGLAVSNVILI